MIIDRINESCNGKDQMQFERESRQTDREKGYQQSGPDVGRSFFITARLKHSRKMSSKLT